MAVKCVFCRKSFSNKSTLKQHFVEEHSIPKSDDVLNRYVDLRFSSHTGDWVRTQKMLVRLLKILKSRIAQNTMNREKVKVNGSAVEKILYNFMNRYDDVDMDSVSNSISDGVRTKLYNAKWFMQYYDVYINKSVSTLKQQNATVSFFSSEESFQNALV